MIAGVGIDLCEVARMERACQSDAFCRRVFTAEELDLAGNSPERFRHLAGFFAAKEAFAKATGLGLSKVGLHNVSVVHDDRGRPQLCLSESATLKPYRAARFHLSISHERSLAAAVVIYEMEGA